jgi:hypothetical protein
VGSQSIKRSQERRSVSPPRISEIRGNAIHRRTDVLLGVVPHSGSSRTRTHLHDEERGLGSQHSEAHPIERRNTEHEDATRPLGVRPSWRVLVGGKVVKVCDRWVDAMEARDALVAEDQTITVEMQDDARAPWRRVSA